MRGTNQGGSLAGFIVVGVLLTLVLVGGLYGLNRYNAEKAGEEVMTEEQAGTEDTSTDTAAERERTATEDKKETTPSNGSSSATSDPGDATSTPTAGSSSDTLPQTGPTDTLYAIFVVSLLAFVATHYVRSRSHNF